MAHYPGYTVLRTEDCPEQHGTLTLLTHDVSGAAVLLVENEDVNKAFGIGFGTFPSDDTGVFHICLLYTSPSPRDGLLSRMPSSA